MEIEKIACRIIDSNSPNPALVEDTLHRMRETQWVETERGRLKKKQRPLFRRCTFFVGAAALVLICLIGINALSPALAESLPFLGGIFRQINRNGPNNLQETQESIQSYAQPFNSGAASSLPALEVPANNEEEQNLHITAEEVYYDGYLFYAGLRLKLDRELDEPSQILQDDQVPDYDIVIDGEGCYGWNERGGRGQDVPGFAALDRGQWTKAGPREYICQRACLLPEKYWNKERLEVALRYKGISTHSLIPDAHLNTSPFTLYLTAERNDAPVKEISCEGIGTNGIEITRAVATPAATFFTLEYNENGQDLITGPKFSDGYALGVQGRCFPQSFENGRRCVTEVFGALEKEETRQVILEVCDKGGSKQAEAIFVIDFQAGTIALGDKDDLAEDLNASYCRSEADALPPGESWALESLSVESGRGFWRVSGPEDGPFPLRVEIYQQETLMGEGSSGLESPLSAKGRLLYDGTLWMKPDIDQPITVKAFRTDTEDLLIEETVILERW